MAAAERFLFEVSFDEEDLARAEAEAAEELAAQQAEHMEPEEDLPTFTEEQIDAARNEGYEAGHEAGIKEAADAIETKINDALGMIAGRFDELFKSQAVDTASTFTDAVNIAVAIARKSFPYLNETHGFPEVERMVREVLTEVLEEPRVIIHVSTELKEALDERIGVIASESNFEGQVIILDAEDIAPGDCRIAWSSGTAERDMAGTLGKIDQIVEANLGSVEEEVAEEIDENGSHADADAMPEPVTDTVPEHPAADDAAPAADAPEAPEAAAPGAETPAPADAETESAPADSTPEEPAPMVEPEAPAEPPATEAAEPSDPVSDVEPEGAPPTPSAELMDQAPEGAETMGSDETGEAADQPSEEDILNAIPPVSDEEREAMTAAHLQAGPGNVDQAPNEAILEPVPEPVETDAETAEDLALDEDRDSAPPRGPNR